MDACELARQLLQRTRHGDVCGALALFDEDADVTPPGFVGRGRGTAAADLCSWLVECFPEDAPVQGEVSGRGPLAALLYIPVAGPSQRPAATVLIQVVGEDTPRIVRARLLFNPVTCATVRQAASDAREDAARHRYRGA
jgi:hypothetical protein